MNKLNSLKIVFTILLAVFSMQQVSAKYWFRLQVEAKCKDTEGNVRNDIGFVAVKFSTQPTEATKRSDLAQSHTGSGADWLGRYLTANVYLLAKGDGNWQFDHWELEDGTTLSNSNQETGTASHTYRSTNRCPSTSSSGNHEHADWITEHTYYAVFREVITQVVFAEAYPETLGEIKYQKENSIGDEITLRTYTLDYHNKFLGWVKQGDEDNIITTDRVLAFTITDETKGTYIAKYDNGYDFVRFKNFGTGRYMDFTNDEGSLQNLTSLELKPSLSDVISEAGSVIEIKEGDVKSSSGTSYRHYFDFYMQNSRTSKFYDFDINDPNAVTNGVFLRMPHDVDINVDTWALSTDDNVQSGYRIGDQNGVTHAYMGKRNEADWYIEPIDKDLETCENYFSLDPNKLVEVDGKYYTTLRTSWNILIDPERTKPYVVTSVDETAGTFEMEPITGNIIPAGTPVIIETSSTDIEANRMVPTLTAAASGAVPSGNLLQHSEKYFPNQSAPVSNCKSLYKNANGQLAFGGNALNTVNGNEAYLSIANEVVLPNEITLGALVNDGNTARKHKVIDLTAVALAGNGSVIIAKDNAEMDLPAATGDQVDYMTLAGIERPNNNQSNWVMLRVPEGQSASNIIDANKKLANVQGRLVNKVNPEVQLDKMPQSADDDSYEPNTYIPASFYGTQVSPVNNQTYFFVQPQPMEYATVKWALWDGSKFATVPITGHSNAAGLQGSFTIDSRYLANGSVDNLVTNAIYTMDGIAMVNNAQAGAPARRAPGDTSYVFYPFNIQQQAESIITAVEDINTASDVMSVTYYDVTGRASDMPHRGINIVVTRHRDGTVTTTKVLK